MKRALWACFGAICIGLSLCAPVAAQDLPVERRRAAETTEEPEGDSSTQTGTTVDGNPAGGVYDIDQATLACGTPTPAINLRNDVERQQMVVTAYCHLLQRPPDRAGMTYWLDALEDGTDPYELAVALTSSPEYVSRGGRDFVDSLSSLTLGPGREAELEQRRAEAEAEAEAARLAEEERLAERERRLADLTETTVLERMALAEELRREAAERERIEAEEQRLADEAASRAEEERLLAEEIKRAARFRERTDISPEAFQATVGDAALGWQEPVTDSLTFGRIDGGGQQVTVAFVHLSQTRGMRVSPGNRGQSTVGTYANEIGAHVSINGNWFAPYDGPAVSGGQVYGGTDHFYTALFGFTADGDAIIEHHRETNETVDDRVVEGVAGHPTLIYRGERTTDFGGDPTFTNRHPRTAIGLDETGDVLILVTVDGRSSSAAGMTGGETAELMERLGAHDAVMLDGGGSSTMWIAGRGIVNDPSGALRAVGNQIAVFGD